MSSQKFKLYFPFILIGFVGVMLVLTMKLFTGGTQPAGVDNFQHATILSPPKPILPFLLTDHNRNKFTEQNLQGKWTLLFAGYTSCPDICPPTMTAFKLAAQQFERLGMKDISFVLLTIDPENDTPEKLNQFTGSFNRDFIGLTGPMDNISDLTKDLGLFHMSEPMANDHDMSQMDHSNHAGMKKPMLEIKHSGSVLLISPKGELFASFSPPIEADNLVQTLARIAPPK
ncbi:MAG: SCO family protein [Gammaproteobacteria bacterium]|nr:SCO family protein [Gammaproteobacteria bacterium]MDH5594629.1 SCO family protein [Gammaproteobacteria bacterium]MDH5614606.1 SCO family protein [Gammaproteobacteria bacterium]